MLSHRLYRSDKTGAVISERFTHLTYPWHWHYTFLRGLDYLRLTRAIRDDRLGDAIQLLLSRRRSNGRWPLQKRIPGTLLVESGPAERAAGTCYELFGFSGAGTPRPASEIRYTHASSGHGPCSAPFSGQN